MQGLYKEIEDIWCWAEYEAKDDIVLEATFL